MCGGKVWWGGCAATKIHISAVCDKRVDLPVSMVKTVLVSGGPERTIDTPSGVDDRRRRAGVCDADVYGLTKHIYTVGIVALISHRV